MMARNIQQQFRLNLDRAKVYEEIQAGVEQCLSFPLVVLRSWTNACGFRMSIPVLFAFAFQCC